MISIIVPIYNVEKYLERCMDSLIKQTCKNIEIILVDDGSSDSSAKICDEYASKDRRIKVIHKKNGGLSDARNTGIYTAEGDYILFVDPDDYIELDACEKFSDYAIEEVDIIVAVARKIELNKHTSNIQNNISSTLSFVGETYLLNNFKKNNGKFFSYAWMNLYRREFILEHRLFFAHGIYFEDVEWTPRVFLKAEKIIGMNYCFYNYIVRENSILKSESNKRKLSKDLLSICCDLLTLSNTLNDKELRRYFNEYIAKMYMIAFNIDPFFYIKNRKILDRKLPLRLTWHMKERILSSIFYFDLLLFHLIWRFRNFLNDKLKPI